VKFGGSEKCNLTTFIWTTATVDSRPSSSSKWSLHRPIWCWLHKCWTSVRTFPLWSTLQTNI